MQEDDNAPAPAVDEPQVIPNEEPLPPPDEHEAKAKKPESQEDEPSEDDPEDKGDGDEPAEDDDKPKRKRPGKYQRTVSRLQGEIEELKSLLIRQNVGQPQQPRPPATQAPKQSDYTDYAEYLEARAEWKAEAKARQVIDQERQAFQQTQVQGRKQATWAAYQERVEAAREKYADFDEVAYDDSVPITDPMADAMQTAENGPDINYYLGSHPDEARKIARMDPISQVRAIGRLEAKLLTPSPKKTTSAPKPVKPLAGTATGGVGSSDPSKMSMEEYVKWRAAGNG